MTFTRARSETISIHVPRVEDDFHNFKLLSAVLYFNPRPPCGGRLFLLSVQSSFFLFQSTSPVWRTTSIMIVSLIYQIISIHVPRVEDDHVFYCRQQTR